VADDAQRSTLLLEEPVHRLGEERRPPRKRGRGLGEGDADLPVDPRRRPDLGQKLTDVVEVCELAEVGEAEETRHEDDVVGAAHAGGQVGSAPLTR
jgi:hypothetical protein